MMKKMRKIIVLLLCSIMLFENVAWAAEPVDNIEVVNQADIYAAEYSEELSIDGSTYTYNYYYNSQGNRTIEIIDNLTKETDIVEYDSKTAGIFLNGECVSLPGTQDEQLSLDSDLNSGYSTNSRYTKLGTVNKTITWKETTTAKALVAMIALVIGHMTGAMVLAKIGRTAVNAIIDSAKNGVVKATIYSMTAGKVTNYKYVWSFTPKGGKKYGDYTSYVTV